MTSGVDVQGTLCRFTGVVEGPQGQIGPESSDACECDASGRIRLLLTSRGSRCHRRIDRRGVERSRVLSPSEER